MPNGKYLYCIMEGSQDVTFREAGLFQKDAFTVAYKDISAIVSNVPLKEMQPDAESITHHQRVVEQSRTQGTILPARFGIMFKSEDGVKQMLAKSYKDLKGKMAKIRGKDEFGLKVLIEESNLKKFSTVSHNNAEIKKIKKEIAASGEGTSYFLKMKMDEAIRNDTYRRIEALSQEIHSDLGKTVSESCLLRSDFDQIILNAAYLIDRAGATRFHKRLESIKTKYAKEGFTFHLSGPWAPYSFC